MGLVVSVLFISLAAGAQTPPAPGIVRGRLIEWETQEAAGQLSIRAANNQVFRFLFDAKTYVERDKQRTTVRLLEKGDELEIVSDLGPPNALRYARTVHVVEPERPARPPMSAGRYRVPRPRPAPVEYLVTPRGTLTFSGVIARLNDERMVLRTRADGEKVIYFCADTRYLKEGLQVQGSALHPNTRVFVRGGRNLENEIEAYQVVWGEILMPDVPR